MEDDPPPTLAVHDDHPLALELASLRAAVSRYQAGLSCALRSPSNAHQLTYRLGSTNVTINASPRSLTIHPGSQSSSLTLGTGGFKRLPRSLERCQRQLDAPFKAFHGNHRQPGLRTSQEASVATTVDSEHHWWWQVSYTAVLSLTPDPGKWQRRSTISVRVI
ncbi:hypothetical protein NUW54_g8537 [Trametes sanguinea]|uniref:Uncharacterized protein n=1 Tax=Trametes sanguinea TaxID=158606 RepID=A0ACC1PFC2_9APHY|nr:hypothetical protein NUW54_g8537 [Trametes sanguinea]